MEDYLKQAIEIVKAQASVRNMNEDEITSMIRALTQSIRGVAEGVAPVVDTEPAVDPKNAIREKSVICCECGKSFKGADQASPCHPWPDPRRVPRKSSATRKAPRWSPSPSPGIVARPCRA